jgi:hypothetical protein
VWSACLTSPLLRRVVASSAALQNADAPCSLVQASTGVGFGDAEAQSTCRSSSSQPRPTTSGGAFIVSANDFLQSQSQPQMFVRFSVCAAGGDAVGSNTKKVWSACLTSPLIRRVVASSAALQNADAPCSLVQASTGVGFGDAEAQSTCRSSSSQPRPTTSGGAFIVSANDFLQSLGRPSSACCLNVFIEDK